MTHPPLYVGRPNIGDRKALFSRINAMLDRRWLTNDGPLVTEFESKIKKFLGVRNCVLLCNATVGLTLAARALELTGEIILPSFTFVATAHSAQWEGLTPVFADIDPATHNIDPTCIERLITPQTAAIMGVHVWGRPCNTDAIASIGQRFKLPIIYDAAHAFGCSHNQQMIGGFGDCEILSFHATKFINSFEGGAVVTNSDTIAEKVRLMRNFGLRSPDYVESLGINGKMSEVSAAMGLTSLEAIDDIVAVNYRNFKEYQHALAGIHGLSIINFNSTERNNYQYIVLELDPAASPISRDKLLDLLHAQGIFAKKYFWPGCHRMEPYRSISFHNPQTLPHTEELSVRVIVLPTGQETNVPAIQRICSIIRNALGATRTS